MVHRRITLAPLTAPCGTLTAPRVTADGKAPADRARPQPERPGLRRDELAMSGQPGGRTAAPAQSWACQTCAYQTWRSCMAPPRTIR